MLLAQPAQATHSGLNGKTAARTARYSGTCVRALRMLCTRAAEPHEVEFAIDSVVNSNSVRMTVLTPTSPAENIFACSPLQAAFFRVDPILVTVTPGETLSGKCARVSGALTHPGLLHPDLESPGRHIWNEASDCGDLCGGALVPGFLH